MIVPAAFVDELERLRELPENNLKVIAAKAGVDERTIWRVRKRHRAWPYVLKMIAAAFPTLAPHLPHSIKSVR